jgi:membrane glycosyltransferase
MDQVLCRLFTTRSRTAVRVSHFPDLGLFPSCLTLSIVAYFTNVVYTAIKYGVGSGDVSPFVGHNAFLRWKALQSIEFVDPKDRQTKWWSDAHVSEDFDISLRLQMQGMVVRLATYHNGGFKEGVSLTLYDELTRWEKYAYGCNELVFHPL